MYKDGVLTITDWTKGMADSAYQGFSSIANCEVFETPGVLKMANATSLVSTDSLTGLPIAYVKDPSGNYYFLTEDAKFYKNGTLISDLGTIGWDLCLYNNYIIASVSNGGDGQLIAYGTTDASPTLFSSWKTGLNGVYYLKLIPARDGNLYITNGDYMARISSFVAGAPTVAPTASLNTGLMQLPANNAGVTAVEIGAYMLIGTQALNGSYGGRNTGGVANLYLWDKSDTKPSSLAGALNESSIQAILSYGNRAYIIAGTRGNVYISDTTSFTKIKRIPWSQNATFGALNQVYPNAIALNANGNLLIGTSYYADSSIRTSKTGIWEMNISAKGYPTIFKQQISTGNDGTTTQISIGFIYIVNNIPYLGWRDGSSYGLDMTDFRLYTGHASVVETELMQIATRNSRKTFQRLEFLLGKKLSTGQEIKLYYRRNLTDSYTPWKTFNHTTLGEVNSHDEAAALESVQTLQLKLSMTQPTSAVFGENIELLNLTIW